MSPISRWWYSITFPTDASYNDSLGKLRKRLKGPFPGIQVHKRAAGALVIGGPEWIAAVPLILPSGFCLAGSSLTTLRDPCDC